VKRAIPIVFLLLASAGCKRTLHWKAIEDQLVASMSEKASGYTFTVECPETAVEAGLKFRCHATASDGSKGDIEVELKDTAGSWASHPVR
jgi:hypothetical protein